MSWWNGPIAGTANPALSLGTQVLSHGSPKPLKHNSCAPIRPIEYYILAENMEY